MGVLAPAVKSPGVGDYLCIHHHLTAHAAAYRLYQQKYAKKFGGQVGIALDLPYYIPKDSSVTPENQQRALLYRNGFLAQPIFGATGNYPQVMIDEIAARSVVEGRAFSRLPMMSVDLVKYIRGTADFFGLNYYTSFLMETNKTARETNEEPSWLKDVGIQQSADPNWKQSKLPLIYDVPQGLRSLLNWIKDEYNNPPVFITENGWGDEGQMEDVDRIEYFNSHLGSVLQALHEDKCNIIGYTAWSLIDSFEWNGGYNLKFGLFNVNYTSSEKERIPKKSADYMRNVIKSRSIKMMS